MSCYSADALLAMAPLSIVDGDDVNAVQALLAAIHARDSVGRRAADHARGTAGPCRVDTRVALVRDDNGSSAHMLAQVQDINERRLYEQRLEHMADYEPLLQDDVVDEAAVDAHRSAGRRRREVRAEVGDEVRDLDRLDQPLDQRASAGAP